MSRVYGVKEIIGDSACPPCTEAGRDRTGNHLMHWRNNETQEEWVHCNRCGKHEFLTELNRDNLEGARKVRVELTPEELEEALAEVEELPIKALTSRAIRLDVAQRFGVRVGLDFRDGETPISHFYPKTKGGEITGYKVRSLDPKYFYAVGDGSGCDLFGINQAQKGDVWGEKLFLFEDELSAMSGFQALSDSAGNSKYKPACVSLPDGSKSVAAAVSRNRRFLDGFAEIVVCMDNDDAGDEAAETFRKLYPDIKICRAPKGKSKGGGDIKDPNDMLMDGRQNELVNLLRFKAAKESPASSVSIADCIEEALKKPEWGQLTPWKGFNDLTYGLRTGEIIAIGAGVSIGKTLIAHELSSYFVTKYNENVGVFLLEETVGDSVKNIAGKSANQPFHRPDVEFDPEVLRSEAMKYDGKLFLYNNFGQNEWEEIKKCIRFWVVENQCKWIFLDNITALVGHMTPAEANTAIGIIASELAMLCKELDFTCFVFSHLNAPNGGPPHEEGGAVKEVQFTGSRSLMRWCQLIIGFERNKQADGDAKNYSVIRLLKDRKYGKSGIVHMKYVNETGRLLERNESEINPEGPFLLANEDYSAGIDGEVIY